MFHGCDFCVARTVQLNINSFEHSVQIIRDFRIPESDDTISFPLKPKLPFTIALGVLVATMMSAVEFDDQMFGRTEEVHDVRTDWRLTAEVCAQQGKFFQSTPQYALMRRSIGSQSLGCCTTDRC
jgi:hypothetical protein